MGHTVMGQQDRDAGGDSRDTALPRNHVGQRGQTMARIQSGVIAPRARPITQKPECQVFGVIGGNILGRAGWLPDTYTKRRIPAGVAPSRYREPAFRVSPA